MSSTPQECQKGHSHGLYVFQLALSHRVFNEGTPTVDYVRMARPRLHSYLGGIVRGMDGVAEIVNSVEDHVHILASLRPIHCLADVMRDLKKDSTNWVKESFERRFAWQEGYAAFTVSPKATDKVRNYIAQQQRHHAKHSFIDELKELLERAGIAYQEKYLV
jgi:putative transposase